MAGSPDSFWAVYVAEQTTLMCCTETIERIQLKIKQKKLMKNGW